MHSARDAHPVHAVGDSRQYGSDASDKQYDAITTIPHPTTTSRKRAVFKTVLSSLTVVTSIVLLVQVVVATTTIAYLCPMYKAALAALGVVSMLFCAYLILNIYLIWRPTSASFYDLFENPPTDIVFPEEASETQALTSSGESILQLPNSRKRIWLVRLRTTVRILLVVLGVAAILTLSGIAIIHALAKTYTLPQYNGTLKLKGLIDTVHIEREPNGMVHIRANNDHDLYFGQAVAVAQERLFQMELNRMAIYGRLAEHFGSKMLEKDAYVRNLGLSVSAERTYREYVTNGKQESDPKIKEGFAVLEAYAKGINAYLDSNPGLPLEFYLLGLKSEPWTVVDLIALYKLTALDLSLNMELELTRLHLLSIGASMSRVFEIVPLSPSWSPTIITKTDMNITTPGDFQAPEDTAAYIPSKENIEVYRAAFMQQKTSQSLHSDPSHTSTENMNPVFDPPLSVAREALSKVASLVSRLASSTSHTALAFARSLLTNQVDQLDQDEAVHTVRDMDWTNTNEIPHHLTNSPEASNSWLFGGSRTTTGKPFIANDPHMSFSAPIIWILVHLQSPTVNVIGSAFPGAPGVAIGRTDQIGWSVTNAGSDVQDVYVLDETPDGTGYIYKNNFEPYKIRREVIKVKDEKDFVFDIKESRYGPVIGYNGNKSLALRWTAHEVDDFSVIAMHHANRAKSFDEFKTTLVKFHRVPPYSMSYADIWGNIGFLVPSTLPIRVKGHTGMFAVPGNGSFDWQGFLPLEDIPQMFNPPEDFIATANNRILPPGASVDVGQDWADPYRVSRIHWWNKQLPAATLHDMQDMQGDVYSNLAEHMSPVLGILQFNTNSPTGQEAEMWRNRMTTSWDRRMYGSVEGSIFEAWFDVLSHLPFKSLGQVWKNPEYLKAAILRPNQTDPHCFDAPSWASDDLRRLLSLRASVREAHGDSLDRVDTPNENLCVPWASRAFEVAIQRVKDANTGGGGNSQLDRWGMETHYASYSHKVLSHTACACLANRKVLAGGGTDSLNIAVGAWDPKLGAVSDFGPTYRQILDFSDMERSMFILPTGQSGNLLSEHYDDYLQKFSTMTYNLMRMNGYDVKEVLTIA